MGILRLARFRMSSSKGKNRKLYEKEHYSVLAKYEKEQKGPPAGAERRHFRTEARKCNHWATGGIHDVLGKFNGTYMHMQCSCIDSLIYLWKMCYKRNDRLNED